MEYGKERFEVFGVEAAAALERVLPGAYDGGMKLPVVHVNAEPWYAEGLEFTCTQCGNCCTGGPGYVWISKVEIGRLAEHLKMAVEEVIEKYCRRLGGRYSLNERRNSQGMYDCVFLKEVEATRSEGGEEIVYKRRICEIYPVRPLQCRTWPFWEGLLKSPEEWEGAARGCPGMNRGKRYERGEVEALRDAKDWPK